MLIRMLTGLAALAFKRREKPDPDAVGEPLRRDHCLRQTAEETAAKATQIRVYDGMPEERARFIAAFLGLAFRNCAVISIYHHKDRSFPDIRAGGKIRDVKVFKSRLGHGVSFYIDHSPWYVDGVIEIELEKNAPMLRVGTVSPHGPVIQMAFIPEGGYRDDYELWAKARGALNRKEYFEFAPLPEEQG